MRLSTAVLLTSLFLPGCGGGSDKDAAKTPAASDAPAADKVRFLIRGASALGKELRGGAVGELIVLDKEGDYSVSGFNSTDLLKPDPFGLAPGEFHEYACKMGDKEGTVLVRDEIGAGARLKEIRYVGAVRVAATYSRWEMEIEGKRKVSGRTSAAFHLLEATLVRP
jgi:hypothetical protein